MWLQRKYKPYWSRRFFRISLCHENLQNHYVTNFNLMQHHKYSLTELDNMIPFEREIYVSLLIQHIKEENDRLRDKQHQR